MNQPKIAVLLPCRNESRTIEKVVSDFKHVLPDATIYVYDNHSTDDTAERAARAGATVRHEYRPGKGNVIRRMFREIEADCYIMADGDDTYPAEAAVQMAALVLERQADMVIGDRLSSTYLTENKRLFHNAGNKLVRFLINRLFHSHIHDIMTGYRAFSPLFVKSFPVLSEGFEIETEMTIHALDKNFYLQEIPVNYRNRPEGSVSKLRTIPDGIRVLKTVVMLFREYRPFTFFTFIASLFWLVSLGFFLPVFAEYLQTGLVPRFPTLIVSGVTATFGTLLWICGVILDVVIKKHRQLFELYLHSIQKK